MSFANSQSSSRPHTRSWSTMLDDVSALRCNARHRSIPFSDESIRSRSHLHPNYRRRHSRRCDRGHKNLLLPNGGVASMSFDGLAALDALCALACFQLSLHALALLGATSSSRRVFDSFLSKNIRRGNHRPVNDEQIACEANQQCYQWRQPSRKHV